MQGIDALCRLFNDRDYGKTDSGGMGRCVATGTLARPESCFTNRLSRLTFCQMILFKSHILPVFKSTSPTRTPAFRRG